MKPRSLSLILARIIAIIVFVFSLLLFATYFISSTVPREAKVRNAEGEVIGRVALPDRTEDYAVITFAFVMFSGFQIWTLSLIRKEK
jgi:hypothetical protein